MVAQPCALLVAGRQVSPRGVAKQGETGLTVRTQAASMGWPRQYAEETATPVLSSARKLPPAAAKLSAGLTPWAGDEAAVFGAPLDRVGPVTQVDDAGQRACHPK